ncbi:hypothetical protein GPECTOR_14g270 [Gonium pectorale]|uniref:Auxin efflux carrier component n=1 Tax=Gonium pectorale TaxID=33097 RepID=A0A150GMM0_GONPE|nr:hypothetical protein GPECTOR_14g270 [Gonium pectorale]|eukprot:KXZ51031.1 hypothetical protein GPECTOR_14g270 [Gonium pectorale]
MWSLQPVVNVGLQILFSIFLGWLLVNTLVLWVGITSLSLYYLGLKLQLYDTEAWRTLAAYVLWIALTQLGILVYCLARSRASRRASSPRDLRCGSAARLLAAEAGSDGGGADVSGAAGAKGTAALPPLRDAAPPFPADADADADAVDVAVDGGGGGGGSFSVIREAALLTLVLTANNCGMIGLPIMDATFGAPGRRTALLTGIPVMLWVVPFAIFAFEMHKASREAQDATNRTRHASRLSNDSVAVTAAGAGAGAGTPRGRLTATAASGDASGRSRPWHSTSARPSFAGSGGAGGDASGRRGSGDAGRWLQNRLGSQQDAPTVAHVSSAGGGGCDGGGGSAEGPDTMLPLGELAPRSGDPWRRASRLADESGDPGAVTGAERVGAAKDLAPGGPMVLVETCSGPPSSSTDHSGGQGAAATAASAAIATASGGVEVAGQHAAALPWAREPPRELASPVGARGSTGAAPAAGEWQAPAAAAAPSGPEAPADLVLPGSMLAVAGAVRAATARAAVAATEGAAAAAAAAAEAAVTARAEAAGARWEVVEAVAQRDAGAGAGASPFAAASAAAPAAGGFVSSAPRRSGSLGTATRGAGGAASGAPVLSTVPSGDLELSPLGPSSTPSAEAPPRVTAAAAAPAILPMRSAASLASSAAAAGVEDDCVVLRASGRLSSDAYRGGVGQAAATTQESLLRHRSRQGLPPPAAAGRSRSGGVAGALQPAAGAAGHSPPPPLLPTLVSQSSPFTTPAFVQATSTPFSAVAYQDTHLSGTPTGRSHCNDVAAAAGGGGAAGGAAAGPWLTRLETRPSSTSISAVDLPISPGWVLGEKPPAWAVGRSEGGGRHADVAAAGYEGGEGEGEGVGPSAPGPEADREAGAWPAARAKTVAAAGRVRRSATRQLTAVTWTVAKNPLLWSLLVALLVNLSGLRRFLDPESPAFVAELGFIAGLLHWFESIAIPVSLVSIGVWMYGKSLPLALLKRAGLLLALKLVALPLLQVACAAALRLPAAPTLTLLLLSLCPTATTSFVIAAHFGHGADVVAACTVGGTVLLLPACILALQLPRAFGVDVKLVA